MHLIKWFNFAAIVASLMVLAIAYILVPDKSWSTAAITSIIFFALATGFIFYVPSLITKKQYDRNAVQMALIGPLGFLKALMLLMTLGTFVLAFNGMDNLAFAGNVFLVCIFIISWLMLRASADVIQNIENENTIPSKHFGWQSDIQNLITITSNQPIKKSFTNLAEKLRYTASDITGGTPQDNLIDSAIEAVKDQLTTDNDKNIQEKISKIEILIEQRNIYLRSARNKA
jgi:hypothetical protein